MPECLYEYLYLLFDGFKIHLKKMFSNHNFEFGISQAAEKHEAKSSKHLCSQKRTFKNSSKNTILHSFVYFYLTNI